MPLTISGTVARSTAVGLFSSLPSNKPADHCHALCNEKAESLVSNALLDGAVLNPQAAHAAHIRKLVRSGDDDDGGVRSGYGKADMWRREEIAVLARVRGSMVGMKFLREAGVDIS